MNFGDLFTKEFKEKHFKSRIDLGSAILVEIPSFNLKYRKFAIYFADDIVIKENCGILVINSQINENVNNNEYLKSQHILIDVARHPFLQYDSYVDCSRIHNHPRKEMIDSIVKDPKTLVGNVHFSIMDKIHELLIKSPRLSLKDKKRYSIIK